MPFLFSGEHAALYNRAVSDPNSCRNKPLAVIGGGDSAAEEATCESYFDIDVILSTDGLSVDLTKYGSHVYVLVRRDELRASKIMAKRVMNNPKIVRILLFPFALHLTSLFLPLRPFYGTPLQQNARVTATSSTTFALRIL